MARPDVNVTIGAEAVGLESVFRRAVSLSEKSAADMEGAFRKFDATIKTLFAGYSAAQVWQGLIKGPANVADELGKLSQRTGVTVEQLSALNYAAGLNDATLKDLEQGLKGLSNKMLDAAKGGKESAAVFDALGINIKDAAGNLRGVDAVFGDLADAFKSLPDGAEKAALANRLMEESGIRLIPTLNAGADGLRDMAAEAGAFGAIISTDLANASVAFNDNLTRLNVQMSAAGKTIGGELIPVLLVASDEMVKFGEDSSAAAVAGDAFATVLETIVVSAANVKYVFKQVGNEIGGWMAQIASIDFSSLFGIGEDALKPLDFSKFNEIGRMMKEDAAAARAEIDAFSERILTARTNQQAFAAAAGESADKTDRAAAVLAKRNALLGDSSKASKAAAAAQREADAAYKRFADSILAVADNAAAAADAEAQLIENAREGLDPLHQQIEAQLLHNEEIGLSADLLIELRARRLNDAAAIAEQTAASARLAGASEAEIAAYEQKAAALRELASLQREGAVKEATIEAAEAARDAWRDISDDVAESLTDAILQGGDAWKSLVKSIEATVIRATILPIVQGGVQAVLQAAGFGPGGGGGGGGLFSQAGNAASLYSTGSSLMGYGQAAYTGYTAAAGGTDLSAAIAAYNSSGYYGTAASLQAGQAAGGVAGSGAGAAVPYLGAMAAFLVAAEWFAGLGNSLRRFGSAVETTLGDTGDIVSRLIDNTNDTVDIIDSRFARAFESDAQAEARLTAYNEDRAQREGGAGYEPTRGRGARLEDVDPLLAEINAAAIESTQAFISSLTGRDSPLFSLSSLFMSRAGDDSTGRLFVRGSGGQDLLSFNQDFKAGQSGFEEFGQSFSRVTLAVLRSMDDLDTGLEAIVDAVDPATAAIESVQAALDLLGQFQSALEAAEAFGNVDDALEAVRIGTLDATAQFGLMREELTRAATAGELSVEQILAGMSTVYQGFTQLLQNIDAASRNVADSTASNIRSIQLSVLDDAGKYGFLDAEIARQLDTLRSLTDPALITDYLGRVQGNLSAAFGLLQDGEQQRLADEFIARFNEVGAIAQQQLDVARDQAIADQRTQRDEMAAAIREAFADPSAALAAAAQTFAGTRIQSDVRVSVDTPAQVEVSTVVLGDN